MDTHYPSTADLERRYAFGLHLIRWEQWAHADRIGIVDAHRRARYAYRTTQARQPTPGNLWVWGLMHAERDAVESKRPVSWLFHL